MISRARHVTLLLISVLVVRSNLKGDYGVGCPRPPVSVLSFARLTPRCTKLLDPVSPKTVSHACSAPSGALDRLTRPWIPSLLRPKRICLLRPGETYPWQPPIHLLTASPAPFLPLRVGTNSLQKHRPSATLGTLCLERSEPKLIQSTDVVVRVLSTALRTAISPAVCPP